MEETTGRPTNNCEFMKAHVKEIRQRRVDLCVSGYGPVANTR
jgi:hypothetical protein